MVHMVWLSKYASIIEMFPYKYQKYTYKVIANVVRELNIEFSSPILAVGTPLCILEKPRAEKYCHT